MCAVWFMVFNDETSQRDNLSWPSNSLGLDMSLEYNWSGVMIASTFVAAVEMWMEATPTLYFT